MKKKIIFASLALMSILLFRASSIAKELPKPLLATLRVEHPRLIATQSDQARVKELIRSNPEAQALYAQIKAQADALLSQPPIDYTPTDYRDNIIRVEVLLSKVRECVDRVYTLLTVYRLENDRRYLERAKKELMNAVLLKDWNPMHFLDTAEMTHAFAIGYDWMYHDLSESERSIFREAIITKGLMPARFAYRAKGLVPWGYWVRARHNWNQVCNGGIALGALAIAEEEPELAEEILESALESVKLPMAEFAPDGAWSEGPSYWSYATQYNVFLLAGLKTALGNDLGLGKAPGFSRTGFFPIYSTGPFGLTFNYGDASDQTQPEEQMFWLAREYHQPVFAGYARKYLAGAKAICLWWLEPNWESPKNLPLDAYFRGAEVAFFRSEWDNPEALFIGFKAGNNRANHSHLDLGSFVFDALGVRWAQDLGKDSYKLPFYFDTYFGLRWRYYRLRTEAHNTLTLNDKNQNPKAQAQIIAFRSTPQWAIAIADLSEAYQPLAKTVRRGIAMLDRSSIIIQDEIEANLPVKVVWSLHTQAEISVNGPKAVLRQKDTNLLIRIVEPEDAEFKTSSDYRPPPENPNPGFSKLFIQLPKQVKQTRIVVELIPYQGTPPARSSQTVIPLANW